MSLLTSSGADEQRRWMVSPSVFSDLEIGLVVMMRSAESMD
jgi:hypothetical protein